MSAEIIRFPRRTALSPLAEARPGDRVAIAGPEGAVVGVVERRMRQVAGDLLYVRLTDGDHPGTVRVVRLAGALFV